ncbi:hypothetical protein GGI23_007125, partial [Coemansia sp. RSA 2559]
MGRVEADLEVHERPPPQQQRASRAWKVVQILLAGGLALALIARYFGGPIQMIPWTPDGNGRHTSTPILTLREVYVQSTPKPPSSLVALSAQGTQAGRAALRAWYEDQAAMARTRGCNFPYRLSHWKAEDNDPMGDSSVIAGIYSLLSVQFQKLWIALGGGHSQRLNANSADDAYSQADSQYSISFANNEQPAAPMKIVSEENRLKTQGESGSGPERVIAKGTSGMLHRMRVQYLQSEHGRRHSYWAESPVRGMSASAYSQFSRRPEQQIRNVDEDEPAPKDPTMGKWDYYIEDGLLVPNVTDKKTLVHLARMAANAYQPSDSE